MTQTGNDARTAYETSPKTALLLACGGAFLAFLDSTITNLAVPALADDFPSVALSGLSWVISLYAILFAALLAPAGRTADVFGRRRLFVIGVLTFTAASLIAGVAPNFATLLCARGVQGVGAAALMPASLALLLAHIPANARASAIGAWSASASLAAAIGPVAGGVLVDALGWRYLFLVNVPIGAVLWWQAARLPAQDTPDDPRTPDLIGTVLLAAGIGLIVVAVTEGPSWGWVSARTIASLLGGIVLCGWVVRRSVKTVRPALEIGLWRTPSYAFANGVSVLFGALLYAGLLVGVLFLIAVWHYDELQAGLAMTPGAFASAAVGILVSRLQRKPSPWTLAVSGSVGLVLANAALIVWLSDEPNLLRLWLPVGLLTGAAVGALSVGVSTAAAMSAPPTSFGSATGLNIAARQVGGALGIAAVAALLVDQTSSYTAIRVYVFCLAAAAVAGVLAVPLRSANTMVSSS